MLKKDKNKVHKPKNTIVGGVKDSIDTNIEKLVNKCNVLDSIYKFDLGTIDTTEKIGDTFGSSGTDSRFKKNTIKKILLCLRIGTDDFYNLLIADNNNEITDEDNKGLANTIYDFLEEKVKTRIMTGSQSQDIINKYIGAFLYNNYYYGLIFVDKDALSIYTLRIDKSYDNKKKEKENDYLIYKGEEINTIVQDLQKKKEKEFLILFRDEGNILNIEKVMGKLIIDFVKTIKADETVFTEYKVWISGEIMKYYVIYFINIFISKYNERKIHKKTLVKLLKNLRIATIGNYRELTAFKNIINLVVKNETEKQLINISSEIKDDGKWFVRSSQISYKCNDEENMLGLQNIIFFSFMLKNDLQTDDNILSKLKYITKNWDRKWYKYDAKKENCDNTIDLIIKDKSFYTKGFKTYIEDLEYKIEEQKQTGNLKKIEIYNNFLNTINTLKTIIGDINSIKGLCDKFLNSYREHDIIAFNLIDDLKNHKINGLNSYNDIFSQ
jgi:hypothetical protein